jgi:hypothetical protein
MELAKREPMRARQLESMRKDDKLPWEERALRACTWVQTRTMAVKPWQIAPCDAVDDEPDPTIARMDSQMREWRKAHAVVERLLEFGLSPYEPDPLGALARARSAA